MGESLRSFFDELEAPSRHLVVLNRSSPDPVRKLLDSLLDGQPVAISAAASESASDDDVVALVEDGSIVARSTLDELLESVLLINSDLYKTGAIELDDVALPDVLTGLDEVPFRVRGYPASNKEKLLLIVVSRVIERIAVEHGGGTLRASFQRLSRIHDERGTRSVYERIAGTGVDVHLYGVGDAGSVSALPVTVHTGTSYPYRRSWFVVFTPPEGADGDHVALLALEDEPNVWDGFWTFRPELVTRIERYIAEEI
ncbi:DICT sensory domain-containing protein [Halorubrum sp. AD140]|uniref:DICT sensory domain-containing protein n=1 Tax=Halorubrum sp. AD140 TaxID=3050073 RepID=UPI002ACC9E9D|nr:DICT sensory domain-containing protein [Halorubrum sp. AD140]MDZ5812368.1 DICT sensory domain-containing protein [Halorubrum sp. AD140]